MSIGIHAVPAFVVELTAPVDRVLWPLFMLVLLYALGGWWLARSERASTRTPPTDARR
jgi:hypothetical protein